MDFFGVVGWGFCWVFCENVVQIVVFCGQLVEQSVANVDSGCAIFGGRKSALQATLFIHRFRAKRVSSLRTAARSGEASETKAVKNGD